MVEIKVGKPGAADGMLEHEKNKSQKEFRDQVRKPKGIPYMRYQLETRLY